MNVVRARNAGACYGVQRALDLALQAVEQGGCAYTLGPLIHNPLVVAELHERGVFVAQSVEDIKEGTIIIRSHGVTPQVRAALEAKGLPVVDATCPHVARAQNAAAQLASEGCKVIVIGEAGHPEVEGLRACALQAGDSVCVATTPDDLPDDLYEPVGVVVQTTQTRENLNVIVDAIKARGVTPQVKDTVCFATRQRQEAAAELAATVDAMVIVGGRNSSNTTRLAEICAATCAHSFHIEAAEELDAIDLSDCDAVGVTAGASTPEDHIEAVVARLEAR